MFRLYALLLSVVWFPIFARANVPTGLGIAASITTITVNAGSIVKWAVHPKKQAKVTVSKIKQAVKGK